YWVNISMLVLCPALVLLRWCIQALAVAKPASTGLPQTSLARRLSKQYAELVPSDVGRVLVLLTIATISGLALKRFGASGGSRLRFTPPQEWPMAWFRLTEATWHMFTSREWLVFQLITPLAAVALLIGFPRLREAARPAWHAGLVLALVALFYTGVVASATHVRLNGYAYRYLIPSLLLLQSASAAIAVSPLGAVMLRQARITRWLT